MTVPAADLIRADNLARARNPRANMPADMPPPEPIVVQPAPLHNDRPTRDLGPCGHFPPCPARAQAAYLIGLRCPAHTPAAMAGRPECRPDPTRTLEAVRTKAGLRPDQSITPTGPTLVDQRAIASGKRRSNPQDYRAARDATR